MLILHDGTGGDLSHIQAIAEISEGFALFDYVRIQQTNGEKWIGQIVQPNQNVSTVGDRLDPTILHGLKLMQTHTGVQAVESVQVFDIWILGQFDGQQMLTPRIRPLPGAEVTKLDAEDTCKVIEIPSKVSHEDGSSNVIGELLNAVNVPLCITEEKFNYHVMIAGGTGSGKSNAAANLITQASHFGKCIIIHDAKPDYGLIKNQNSDQNVASIWKQFERYKLSPRGASDVMRIGFHGKCDPKSVDIIVGFRASDFEPEMLAGLLFPGAGPAEQNAYEGFAGAADALYRAVEEKSRDNYSLDDIVAEVRRRSIPNDPHIDPAEAIHELTGKSILRKVGNRRGGMPWLDAVGKTVNTQPGRRLQGSRLDNPTAHTVAAFELDKYVAKHRLVVVDYSQMEDRSYALILSYFLRTCQQYRKARKSVGIVQLVDEAHRIFDNVSSHSGALARAFERVMREGRSVDHSILLSLQNASQIPPRVMNNLNTKIVMRQNSKTEADAATQTMGKDFSPQAMRLGTGHALVSIYESRATVLAQMAPSPFELIRNDNTRDGIASLVQKPLAGVTNNASATADVNSFVTHRSASFHDIDDLELPDFPDVEEPDTAEWDVDNNIVLPHWENDDDL